MSPPPLDLARVRDLRAEIRSAFLLISAAEEGFRGASERLWWKIWEMGRLLAELKDLVGHGRWTAWVRENLTEFGQAAKTRENKARLWKQFWEENQNAQNSGCFDPESIRKLHHNYVPAKERPALPGDQALPPARHHLSTVNHIATFTRRLEVGLITAPEIDVLRRDFEQPLRKLVAVLGPDWVAGLLAGD